jgi:hypothetical protein
MPRNRLLAGLVAIASLVVIVDPASAKQHTYTATIDCGSGSVVVTSGVDLFAPLVDQETGRRYYPVAWDVKAHGKVVRRKKHGHHRATVECSYDDGTAVGTVTVERRTRSHRRH